MAEPLILHIETSTDICSVAVSEGDQILALVESGPERSHARLLNRFIREAFASCGKQVGLLDAVAVSRGPGSYTGLRIGVSTAKGLAYALEKPLLSCGTLEHMAQGALGRQDLLELTARCGEELLLCPMLDARRMEVYSAFYSTGMGLIRDVSADIVDETVYREILDAHPVCFFGNGAGKCKELLSAKNAHFIDGINPSAGDMIVPVLRDYRRGKSEDVAYFEPFYLKDFVATKPRKKVL